MSGQIQDIGDELRHGHNPHHTFIIHFQVRHHVDLFIQQMRERVVCIHNLRRQDRKHLLFEIFLHVLLLLGIQLLKIQTAHAVRMELLFNVRIGFIPFFIQRRHSRIYGVQLFLRCHAGLAVYGLVINRGHIIQASDTYHKKFIQIARKNCDKLHTLQKRHTIITRLLQHPLVKTQPGQLSVLCIV